MFRWWDGSTWTTHVSPNPSSPAPGLAPSQPAPPAGSLPIREAQQGRPAGPYTYAEIDQRSSKLGPALALGLIGLLIIGMIVAAAETDKVQLVLDGAEIACERSAAMGSGGTIIIKKRAGKGVTMAVARIGLTIHF